MKKRWTYLLLILLGIPLPMKGDFAVAPGTVPIEAAFNQATLVCNCLVNSIDETVSTVGSDKATVNRHEVTAHASIRDAYKSEDAGQRNLVVRYTLDELRGQRVGGSRLVLVNGETALLFLTKVGADTYEFADPFIGATQFDYLPIERGEFGPMKLQRALRGVVQEGAPIDRLRALRTLLGFRRVTEDTIATVTPLTQSQDPDVALTAIGISMRSKSIQSVEMLRKFLGSRTLAQEPLVLQVVGPEIAEIDNPEALAQLEALSTSGVLSVRHGAMDAIRRIRSPRSIPLLISRLDDSDNLVRYVALITLAETAGKDEGDYAPSMYLFDSKPEYYISLWKQWWVDEGRSRYSAPGPN